MGTHDELRKPGIDLPRRDDAVAVVPESGEVPAAGGVIREILLLAEFCATVEEMVDNCGFPDLVVYEALIALRNRGVLRFGDFNARTRKSDFLPPGDLARLRTRLEDHGSGTGEAAGQIAFYLPDPSLLAGLGMRLGNYQDFEGAHVFFF